MVPYYNSAKVRADHCHVAIDVGGVWKTLPTYMDRSIILKQAPGLPWKSYKWQEWSTWDDRKLASCETVKPNDPCEQYKNQIAELNGKLGELETEYKKLESESAESIAKLSKELKTAQDALASMTEQLSKCEQVRDTQKKQWDKCREELNGFKKSIFYILYKMLHDKKESNKNKVDK